MKQLRSSSSQRKNIYALQMQVESQKMEDKLAKLKKNLNQDKLERSQISLKSDTPSRWEKETKVLKEIPQSATNIQTQEVEQFLQSIKLDIYIEKFKENGFEELDVLLDIQNDQLQQMQIPLGHQIRLLKKIKEFKSQEFVKYEMLEAPSIDVSFSQQNSEQQTQTVTESVKKSSLSKTREKQIPKKVKFVESNDLDNGMHYDCLDREISTSINKSYFLSQLEEISKYIKDETIELDAGKDIQLSQEEQQQQQKQKQKLNASDEQKRSEKQKMKEELQQMKQMKQSEITEEEIDKNNKLLRVKKVACWNCYKLLGEQEYIKFENQEFCSKDCLQHFNQLYINECIKCHEQFDLREGIILNSGTFCSEICSKEFDFQIMKDSEEEMGQQFNIERKDYDLSFNDIEL